MVSKKRKVIHIYQSFIVSLDNWGGEKNVVNSLRLMGR